MIVTLSNIGSLTVTLRNALFHPIVVLQGIVSSYCCIAGHCFILLLYCRALFHPFVVLQSIVSSYCCIAGHCFILLLYYRVLFHVIIVL